ncbi:MAG: hypothetical protein HUJ30_04335 [Gammaproteobacteria bacterium]|nr:hypothetical protein [Gammaproteobacteria bacterium]
MHISNSDRRPVRLPAYKSSHTHRATDDGTPISAADNASDDYVHISPQASAHPSEQPTSEDMLYIEFMKLIFQRMQFKAPEILFPSQFKLHHFPHCSSNNRLVLSYDNYRNTIDYEYSHIYLEGTVTLNHKQTYPMHVRFGIEHQLAAHLTKHLTDHDSILYQPFDIQIYSPDIQSLQTEYLLDIDMDGHYRQISMENNMYHDETIYSPQPLAAQKGRRHIDQSTLDPIPENLLPRIRVWNKNYQGNENLLALGHYSGDMVYLGMSSHAQLPLNINEPTDKISRHSHQQIDILI